MVEDFEEKTLEFLEKNRQNVVYEKIRQVKKPIFASVDSSKDKNELMTNIDEKILLWMFI